MRIPLHHSCVHSDALEGFGHECPRFGTISCEPVNEERLREGSFDLQARIKRCVRVLKDHLDVAPEGAELHPGHPYDVATLEQCLPVRCGLQMRQGSSHSGFAAATFADQTQHLPRVDVKTYVVHGLQCRAGPEKSTPATLKCVFSPLSLSNGSIIALPAGNGT